MKIENLWWNDLFEKHIHNYQVRNEILKRIIPRVEKSSTSGTLPGRLRERFVFQDEER